MTYNLIAERFVHTALNRIKTQHSNWWDPQTGSSKWKRQLSNWVIWLSPQSVRMKNMTYSMLQIKTKQFLFRVKAFHLKCIFSFVKELIISQENLQIYFFKTVLNIFTAWHDQGGPYSYFGMVIHFYWV